MKTFIALLIGITMGISLQLASAHTPCNDYNPPPAKPVQICGFQTVYDNNGVAQQVYICKSY